MPNLYKYLLLCFLLLLASAAAAQTSSATPYNIGEKLSPNLLRYIPQQHCVTAATTIEPCVRVRTHGVIYTIGFHHRDKAISYVETHDPAFATPLGRRVGDILSEPAAGLVWVDGSGEVVSADEGDGWYAVLSRGERVDCLEGYSEVLGPDQQHNLHPCRVVILGFKKWADSPARQTEVAAHTTQPGWPTRR